MEQQTAQQTAQQNVHLKQCITTMLLNNVFQQCISTMFKDNSIFGNMPMRLISFNCSSGNRAAQLPMSTNNNMEGAK